MKRVNICLFTILLIAFISISSTWASTTKIVQDNLSKIVMIITFDEHDQPLAIGSGFYISLIGEIATNYHIIEGASSAIIKEIRSDKKISVDRVVRMSIESDLAIIKINKATKAVKLGNDETLLVGQKIVAIGNPEGLEGTVSEGIVSGFRRMTKDFRLIQITAPVSPGSSGGPLFNTQGEAIGIATASIVSGQNLNFAIPINALRKLISEKPLNLKLSQVNFPPLHIKKSKLVGPHGTELVRVVDYSHGTQYVGGSGYFEFSIFNGSLHDISNIKIIVIFYKGIWRPPKGYVRESDYPVHFEAYEVRDTIPSRLSKRIKRMLQVTDVSWCAEFRVLDYEILSSSRTLQFK